MSRRTAVRTPPRRPAAAASGTSGARRAPRGRIVTPFRVLVVVALVGSLAYLAFALTVRDATQIPMLSSGAAVLGLVFGIVALGSAMSAYRAGMEGRGTGALARAVFGGFTAMVAAGCFATAVVLALVWQP